MVLMGLRVAELLQFQKLLREVAETRVAACDVLGEGGWKGKSCTVVGTAAGSRIRRLFV